MTARLNVFLIGQSKRQYVRDLSFVLLDAALLPVLSRCSDFVQTDDIGRPCYKSYPVRIMYVEIIVNLRPLVTGQRPIGGQKRSSDWPLKAST